MTVAKPKPTNYSPDAIAALDVLRSHVKFTVPTDGRPVHLLMVLGKPNILRAMLTDSDAFVSGQIDCTRAIVRSGFVGKRDAEQYPDSRDGDEAWRTHCADVFDAADNHAAAVVFALFNVRRYVPGATLTVVEDASWHEHAPNGAVPTFCKYANRDLLANLTELADRRIQA